MSTNNLYNEEAKEKIKALAEAIDFTMMATNLGHIPFSAIPMSTKKVDKNGTLWFLSGKESQHNKDVLKDPNIQLIYSKPSTMSFMILYGEAQITTDHVILKELYRKSDDLWFEGIEDPNLTAIQFEPKEAHYWEHKHNKLVTLFKMGLGAVTGKQAEIGEEGQLAI